MLYSTFLCNNVRASISIMQTDIQIILSYCLSVSSFTLHAIVFDQSVKSDLSFTRDQVECLINYYIGIMHDLSHV